MVDIKKMLRKGPSAGFAIVGKKGTDLYKVISMINLTFSGIEKTVSLHPSPNSKVPSPDYCE